MEDFYREIYAVNGVTHIEFPEHYPVSRLLGIRVNFYSVINDQILLPTPFIDYIHMSVKKRTEEVNFCCEMSILLVNFGSILLRN